MSPSAGPDGRGCSPESRSRTLPAPADLLLMAVGVLGISTSGPIVAAIAVPALAIAFWRTAFATGVMLPFALGRRLAELRSMSARNWWLTLASGGLLAAHFATWVPSVRYTSVASSTALVSMQVVWTAVLAWLRGERLSRRVWLGMAVALLGVLLVTGVDLGVSASALLGDLLALAGGMFAGAYVVVGSAVRRHVSTTSYTTACYGSCALLLLLACAAAGIELSGWSGHDWLLLVLLTIAAQLLGHTVFNRLLRSVGPVLVSLTILLEVPGASLLAAVWLGQLPPAGAGPAIILILAGIGVVVSARPAAGGEVATAD